MDTKEEIKHELGKLIGEFSSLRNLCAKTDNLIDFGTKYQSWYSPALKLVSLLGPDRLEEFRSYYLIDPKRKVADASNYVIQDYIKGIGAREDYVKGPLWDINNVVSIRLINQVQILQSLSSSIDSVLADVEGHLFAELQDEELKAAQKLITVNLRAAGALTGVVLERHLQRAAESHGLKISKKEPTISDLNDPLRSANVYDTPTWRKIQLLADIRNLCSHKKSREPTRKEVEELISGVNSIIKTVF